MCVVGGGESRSIGRSGARLWRGGIDACIGGFWNAYIFSHGGLVVVIDRFGNEAKSAPVGVGIFDFGGLVLCGNHGGKCCCGASDAIGELAVDWQVHAATIGVGPACLAGLCVFTIALAALQYL